MASAPVFTERTGAANPFNGIDVIDFSAPTFADLDGDGDLDALVGHSYGALRYFENAPGTAITVVVTPETETFTGSESADILVGTGDADRIFGLGGDDTLSGGEGNDLLQGGPGNDVLQGGGGIDTADYSDGVAGVIVDLKTGVVSGGAGADSLSGIESIIGSAFDDRLTGSADANLLDGGEGDDRLSGLNDDDSLIGGQGDDLLIGGAGNDHLDGGVGRDSASYRGALGGGGVTVNLLTGLSSGAQGFDILINIEDLIGSDFDDVLTGNGGANQIEGGTGNDKLVGGLGNDLLIGGLGADILEGGSGDDALFANSSLTNDVGDNLPGPDSLYGGTGNDLLHGGIYTQYDGGADYDSAIVTAVASSGSIVFAYGGWANGKLYQIFVDGVAAGSMRGIQDLTFHAGDAADRITGGVGNDVLYGQGGGDRLKGNTGNDSLFGGAGRDYLEGGLGRDILTGGSGQDTFRFRSVLESQQGPLSSDLITDLSDDDRIDLSFIDADTTVAGDQAFLQVAAFTGAAGQLSLTYDAGAGQTTLAVDVNGDGLADFALLIAGEHLSAAGWVL